jgi:Xaa-Pro dipeptidase
MRLNEIQAAIKELGGDGWLFFDIHRRDKLAYRILDLDPDRLTTRRWYYYVPAAGEPQKLVSRVEGERLDDLPGAKATYLGWKEMHAKLGQMLASCRRLFMQYSPHNNIPMISYADAGTVELVRSFGIEVLSSATLVQMFEARLTEKQIELHRLAGQKVYAIKDRAFAMLAEAVKAGRPITEYDVQSFIVEQFAQHNLTADGERPMVAVNAHAADPHFELTAHNSLPIQRDDRVLIDMWAREAVPDSIYYDITWCGYMGAAPPDLYARLFGVVVNARKAAQQFIADRLAKQEPMRGWEVDDVCRGYIASQGYGEYFLHRTGHSIHSQVHGNGVNMDNLETRDDREIILGSCFSIEPGIYLGDIGVRSEVDILLDYDGHATVVGQAQESLICIDL